MDEEFVLEKWQWTDADFDIMGWHDCPVYAMRFDDDIYFDIDYILKWVINGNASFTYWIAPATLVFEKPTYLKIDIQSDFINGFEIAEILKTTNESFETLWTMATQQGDIIIKAASYKQIIRRPPSFQFSMAVPNEERGEISFSMSFENDYRDTYDITIQKAQHRALFKLVQERRALEASKDQLVKTQDTKSYILRKREIEDRVSEIDRLLVNTIFQSRH